MSAAIQFGAERMQAPEIRVTRRATREAIDTQLDLEKMLAAAAFEQGRFFGDIAGRFLMAARMAFRWGSGVLDGISFFGAGNFEHIVRVAEILAATRILGRVRIRKETGLPLAPAERQFAEALAGVGVEQAVAYLRSLPIATQQEWRQLLRMHQQQAFTAAGVESKAALDALRNLVADGLSQDWTADQFEAKATDLLAKFQEESGTLRTLWNTVTANAMAQGRKEMLDDPEVRAIVSYRLYDAILDSHTRPNHALLDGGIAPWDWEGWGTYAPPNGFNCRCTLVGLTAPRANSMMADGRGFDLTEKIPGGAGPDPGFGKAA